MASHIDIQRVLQTLGDSKIVNLDMSLREIVASPTGQMINAAANLEPWDLICYTWVTLIRRRAFDELTIPVARVAEGRIAEAQSR
jgi:hypothetical protein